MKSRVTVAVLAGVLAAGLAVLAAQNGPVFCMYCGHKAASVSSLTANNCQRHPLGPLKGRHALYEGSEKESYTCKYCGRKAGDIRSLTSGKCMRHPSGALKGNHVPAL